MGGSLGGLGSCKRFRGRLQLDHVASLPESRLLSWHRPWAGPSGLAELLSEWAGLPGKRSYSWAGRPVGHEGLGAHAFGRGSFPGAGLG
jgi:hypothetical protein